GPPAHARHHLPRRSMKASRRVPSSSRRPMASSRRPMSRHREAASGDLFAGGSVGGASSEPLADGATLLRRFCEPIARELVAAVAEITAASPFRNMVTPGGYTMSVAMTNCGRLGWVTDRRGYRYDPIDPTTQAPWPSLPAIFHELATRAAAAAGFGGFEPD